jgi:hypothetical protein
LTSNEVETPRGKVLLIEGGLFYDNLHFANGDASIPMPGRPKRFSLWEIHPVTSVKVCQKATVMIQTEPPIGTIFFSLTNDVPNQPPLCGPLEHSSLALPGHSPMQWYVCSWRKQTLQPRR